MAAVSFCVGTLGGAVDVEQMARDLVHVNVAMEDMGEVAWGWSGPNHLLDGLWDDDVLVGNTLLQANLVKAQKVFPATRLKAEIALEIKAESGAGFVSKKRRKEIAKDVKERLFKDAPVGLGGISVVVDGPAGRVYSDAFSDGKLYALDINLHALFGKDEGKRLGPLTPETAIALDRGLKIGDLKPLRFGMWGQEEMFCFHLGREFLTWLLMCSETAGDMPDLGDVLVEGPLVFVGGTMASKVTLAGDLATRAEETIRALEAGRLLKSARVTLVPKGDDETAYPFTVDADYWHFKGLKLPKQGGFPDAKQQLVHRLKCMKAVEDMWLGLFRFFVDLKVNDQDRLQESVQKWIEWKLQRDQLHVAPEEVKPVKGSKGKRGGK